jgi:hypothetical protein
VARGTATPAYRLALGQTVGTYRGRAWRPLGTLTRIETDGETLLLYMQGSPVPWRVWPATILRVLEG